MLLAGAVAAQSVAVTGLGATPTFGSAGVTTASTTLAATHNVAYPSGVALGNLLLCVAVGRCASPDALLAMHASMDADGWEHVEGSPFAPTSLRCLLIAWKFAVAADVSASIIGGNIVGGIVGSGGAANNGFLAHCQRWKNVDLTTPFESISFAIETIQLTHIHSTITPAGANRRGVGIFGGQATSASFSPYAGATGGTWTTVAHLTGTQCLLNTQSADLSVGVPISGGTATLGTAAGGPLVCFALRPGTGEEEPPLPPGSTMFVTWFAGYDAKNPPSAIPYANYDNAGMFESDIPWALGITHLLHFSAWPQSDSSVVLNHFSPATNPAAVMASRAAAASSAKVIMVMGGADSDNSFFAAIANNQALLVDNIVALVVAHGYDGVDIDWEAHPLTASQVGIYNGFVRALKVDLAIANPTLTLSISGTSRSKPLDEPDWQPMLKALYNDGIIDWIYVQLIQMSQPSFSDDRPFGTTSYVWHHVALYSNSSDFGIPGWKAGVDEAIDDYVLPPPNGAGINPQALVIGTVDSGLPWIDGLMDIAPGSGGCFEPLQKWTQAITANRPDTLTEVEIRTLRKMVPEPVTVTLSANRRGCGGLITLGNAAGNANQPHLVGASSTGNSTAPSAGSITTTAPNTIVLCLFAASGAHNHATIQAACPAGWTFVTAQTSENLNLAGNAAQNSIGIARKTMAAPGATGAATWTGALSISREWLGVQIAFNTAGTGLPTFRGAESFIGHTKAGAGENIKQLYLHEQSYQAGDYVLGVYSAGGGVTALSMTSSDDTYAQIAQVTSATLSLTFFEATVVGGSLGGPTTYRRDVGAGGTAFLSNPLSTLFLSFDDEVSLPPKVQYILSTRGCRGFGIWNVGWDFNPDGSTVAARHPCINAIKQTLDGL